MDSKAGSAADEAIVMMAQTATMIRFFTDFMCMSGLCEMMPVAGAF